MLVCALWLASAGCQLAPARGHAERLYVLPIGEHTTEDVSRWSPGVDVGKPFTFANHCYLIRHPRGLLLWDTGYDDAIADLPEGRVLPGGVRIRVTRRLLDQLAELGVAPTDITHLALSHLHLDHAGNCGRFANATVYLQRLEHDAAFGAEPERQGFDRTVVEPLRPLRKVLLEGDHDVFGDGSVVIVSTPGHTVGHQSLLVRLAHTGTFLLSGDAAHMRSNWDNRRVPVANFDRAATLRSMQRLSRLLGDEQAQLVIQHDPVDGARLPKAPAFLE